MERKFSFSLYSLEHRSLVLLKEISDVLRKVDITFSDLSERCQDVIEDNIIEESCRKDVVFVNEPASAEDFGYSIRNFKKNQLIELKELFSYTYGITKNNKYKRVVECIDIVLKYREQQLEFLFNQAESMESEDLDFYVQLIPRDTVEKMADYCCVEPKNLSVGYLKQEYNKVKTRGRI